MNERLEPTLDRQKITFGNAVRRRLMGVPFKLIVQNDDLKHLPYSIGLLNEQNTLVVGKGVPDASFEYHHGGLVCSINNALGPLYPPFRYLSGEIYPGRPDGWPGPVLSFNSGCWAIAQDLGLLPKLMRSASFHGCGLGAGFGFGTEVGTGTGLGFAPGLGAGYGGVSGGVGVRGLGGVGELSGSNSDKQLLDCSEELLGFG
ncbi:hypothetical protein BT96DRAFT_944382 [Gymnopus androsaceus JB14]|uniref:Uncharacterized protein n=1 Tax=Gymnopus androsaceus JB14 TaxID=1447944 RepID=A0A6A4H4M7_9AGAR|nr:hypothetical protein BT96DRAFT_944382 [Gymnopus androsaceus JB14]